MQYCYQLYGLTLASDLQFSGLPPGKGEPFLILRASEESWPCLSAPSYISLLRTEDGKPAYFLHEIQSNKAIHVTKIGLFLVDWPKRSISYWLYDEAPKELLQAWVTGPLFGFVLEWQGIYCLHAGAIAFQDRAIAFAGPPGAGKSSILAACVKCGWSLLTDDILPLTESKGQFWAIPSYPGLRLWPEVVSCFYGAPEGLPRIHPEEEKRYVYVGEGWGKFQEDPCPLNAIYVLTPANKDEEISIIPLSRSEAMIALITHTFINLARDKRMRIRQFDTCARLVRQVPVYQLRVPQDLSRLIEVCEVIATAPPFDT